MESIRTLIQQELARPRLEEARAVGPFWPSPKQMLALDRIFGVSVDELTPEKFLLLKAGFASSGSLHDIKVVEEWLG